MMAYGVFSKTVTSNVTTIFIYFPGFVYFVQNCYSFRNNTSNPTHPVLLWLFVRFFSFEKTKEFRIYILRFYWPPMNFCTQCIQ